MPALKALIFDVDGTLADTERDGHRIAFNQAFKEAETVLNDEDDFRTIHQDIWNAISKTYTWRMQQVQEGKIEVRTADTIDELEDIEREEAIHANELLDVLAMKRDNARFDDYSVLINRVE